jgi:hypothetical protein
MDSIYIGQMCSIVTESQIEIIHIEDFPGPKLHFEQIPR